MADEERPGRLINVKSELVRDHLVEAVAAAVDGRPDEAIPVEYDGPLARTAEWVLGGERVSGLPGATVELAAALARHGYLTRVVEREMFAPAQARIPWLAALLEERARDSGDTAARGSGAASAVARLSAELAGAEPEARPDPAGNAPSWRVPGPGGHVRHYVALRAAASRGPRDPQGKPRLGQGTRSPGELKRCWMFGFLVRCCEETEATTPDREPGP